MDATYFLKNRMDFIRNFYATGTQPFREIQDAITGELPPFDNPPYSEDPEPAFLEQWLDAEASVKVLGISCVALLSESLKLYFQTLEHRVIGFSFPDRKKAFKHGFLAAYLEVLGSILGSDWTDCPADLDVLEQHPRYER